MLFVACRVGYTSGPIGADALASADEEKIAHLAGALILERVMPLIVMIRQAPRAVTL